MASVSDIPDDELLGRAVKNARAPSYRKGQKHYRWYAVSEIFALGSTYSYELCERFNLDPEEMVQR
jgi:hypothetical protein